LPKVRNLFRHAWLRLKEFVFRAGKVVLIMVTVLGFMGSVGTDGSFGNDNNEKSVLSAVGTVITPVFEPFGVERDNWPASVALFTGLFAKEAIVGTLNSLYAIEGSGDAA
jgi:ferrous iron transport protein B